MPSTGSSVTSMRLRANVLGRAVYRVEEGELSGLGAAITAAAGVDVSIVPDLAVRRFVPDEAAAARYAAERLRRRDEITDLLLRGPR